MQYCKITDNDSANLMDLGSAHINFIGVDNPYLVAELFLFYFHNVVQSLQFFLLEQGFEPTTKLGYDSSVLTTKMQFLELIENFRNKKVP